MRAGGPKTSVGAKSGNLLPGQVEELVFQLVGLLQAALSHQVQRVRQRVGRIGLFQVQARSHGSSRCVTTTPRS